MALKLGGHEIHAMSTTTFYFVLIVLVIVDIAQGRYQKKIDIEGSTGVAAVEGQ